MNIDKYSPTIEVGDDWSVNSIVVTSAPILNKVIFRGSQGKKQGELVYAGSFSCAKTVVL